MPHCMPIESFVHLAVLFQDVFVACRGLHDDDLYNIRWELSRSSSPNALFQVEVSFCRYE